MSMRFMFLQGEILRVIREQNGQATTQTIMAALELDLRTVQNTLFRLKKADAIECPFRGVYQAK